ncbi:SIR2 family protein [Bacillus sp. FJAT-26390]|uniref:SIR2 family protein n=1 Tax=Bacillus sp. FJAT-26390 TaxID=1743142 RepID=UPI000807C85B|nr:SIR2 family protein [Bacillus sp. FJAT-26390]OBZ09133.1 hypothetical protein A7975_23750 [Bacillus sp. FJAT-26390]
MRADTRDFIRSYSKAIIESNAAVFAGAGLSKPAGFVNWKELLLEIAEDLSLDIDAESDLISLAQYHVNERGRSKLNRIIMEEFTREGVATDNHNILANLPIQTYWTTNYDSLIEDCLRQQGRRIDVKITKENLALTLPNRHATVYKMHGDKSFPNDAVITRDDYEGYNQIRQPFTIALQGDLISKTFLFIGFSFDDPNLQYILSRVRILLGENQRDHYCFMRKVAKSQFTNDEKYQHASVLQELRIKDLRRYRIHVVLVDEYEEITEILRILAGIVLRTNVFVSGSAHEYGLWGEERAFNFANELGKVLIQHGYNIVTGFGLGIGSSLMSGALEEIYRNPHGIVEDRLLARPFPQSNNSKELWTRYRNDMISKVGIAIFIFGNKKDHISGETVPASGMVEEFNIAFENNVIPIPIATTGYTTKELWGKVKENFDLYVHDKSLFPLYEKLENEVLDNKQLIELILVIIKKLESV